MTISITEQKFVTRPQKPPQTFAERPDKPPQIFVERPQKVGAAPASEFEALFCATCPFRSKECGQ